MKRNEFIKKSILTYLGLTIGPSLLASCRKEIPLPDSDFSGKVIIVGAGAAGLYTGYILQSIGSDFIIIEASERPGGRLGENCSFADYPIDLGAQWLHGKNSVVGDLIKDSKTKITKDNSDTVFWFNNEITNSTPKNAQKILNSGSGLTDISFIEYAEQQGLDDKYKYLVEQIAGDSGADASEISIKWNAIEEDDYSSGYKDYKFEATFFDFLDKNITAKIKNSIQLNSPVSHIDYSVDNIIVTDTAGNEYNGDKIIVTVPITILQDEYITFTPALSPLKVEAFKKIGMGAGMKVFLKFSTKFYDENIGGGEICAAYADDLIGKNGKDHVLLAFVMGQQAENLTSLGSDSAITNALLSELDTMYSGQATASFIDSHVENWTTKPFIKGAYSFSKIGIGNSRSLAAEPVDNKLFFAGEAMNLNGHHQTVHGAFETGYNQVVNILNS